MAPSGVWLYFQRVENGKKVRCSQCRRDLTYCGSTTSMAGHLQKVHKIILKAQPPKRKHPEAEVIIAENEDEPNEGPGTSSSIEHPIPSSNTTDQTSSFIGPLDRCISNAKSFSAGGTRQEQCTDALLYMIAKDTMPLCTTERKGFKKFMQVLQPHYHPPSEPTITKKMHEKYSALRVRAGTILSQARRIVLTTDIWTQKSTMASYLGVTAHYVEDEVHMKSIELGARLVTERKTTANLRVALRQMCDDWSIPRESIVAVISDGGANIKGAIKEEFGVDKHISCFAHQLNNIGQRALGLDSVSVPSEQTAVEPDLPERESDDDAEDGDAHGDPLLGPAVDVKTVVKKVKRIVTFFRHSEVATSELLRLQREELDRQGINQNKERGGKKVPLKLIQEVRTRWNSCYAMLDRYRKLSAHVTSVLLTLQRSKASKSKPPAILTAQEEDVVSENRSLLKPLWCATEEICSEKNVTLSKCILFVKNIKLATEKFLPTTGAGFNLKHALIAEVESKFAQIEFVKPYAMASLLDPRFKKWGFGVNERSVLALANAISNAGDLVKSRTIRESARATGDEADEQDSQRTNTAGDSDDEDLWAAHDRTVLQNSITHSDQDNAGGIPIELRQFLNRPALPRESNPNPLLCWKGMKSEYPHTFEVALDYLVILATSVPSERLFSHAGLISSQLRNRLSGKNLEEQVFLRSCSDEMWFSST